MDRLKAIVGCLAGILLLIGAKQTIWKSRYGDLYGHHDLYLRSVPPGSITSSYCYQNYRHRGPIAFQQCVNTAGKGSWARIGYPDIDAKAAALGISLAEREERGEISALDAHRMYAKSVVDMVADDRGYPRQ
jgi:hypothetical protein